VDQAARITELETALADLLGAVKKRSAWDYSDVLDEVWDAEAVLGQRDKQAPDQRRRKRDREPRTPLVFHLVAHTDGTGVILAVWRDGQEETAPLNMRLTQDAARQIAIGLLQAAEELD
jgi:hypothetical protein